MKTSIYCLLFLTANCLISCSGDDNSMEIIEEIEEGEELEEENVSDWGVVAEKLQQQTYNIYLTSGGTYKQDNQGNENFNYWWNAHMLDALTDYYP